MNINTQTLKQQRKACRKGQCQHLVHTMIGNAIVAAQDVIQNSGITDHQALVDAVNAAMQSAPRGRPQVRV